MLLAKVHPPHPLSHHPCQHTHTERLCTHMHVYLKHHHSGQGVHSNTHIHTHTHTQTCDTSRADVTQRALAVTQSLIEVKERNKKMPFLGEERKGFLHCALSLTLPKIKWQLLTAHRKQEVGTKYNLGK